MVHCHEMGYGIYLHHPNVVFFPWVFKKNCFFHPRKQLFLTASVFPTTAWLSENYMFEIAFLPDQTAFFPDPD